MEPVTLVTASLAVVFALVAWIGWRRAADLGARVRALEARLEALPSPEPVPEEPDEAEPVREEPDESEPAPPPAEVETGKTVEPEPPEPEPALPLEPDEPAPLPPVEAAPAGPDPLRLEALQVVAEAYETCRYLDFDAIVEKPSTYRVTVPLTAANARAVRYLEDGMFPCLAQVRLDDDRAVLHVDMSKGPP